MNRVPIYTTGNGHHKQYARRDDGTWFYRVNRLPGSGWNWTKWKISADQKPLGLYVSKRAGSAILPSDEEILGEVKE